MADNPVAHTHENPDWPLASICIPTFNRAASLRRAVESACQQSYPALEIVVVDNASSDATQSLLESMAASDARIRYVRNDENIGAVANFNRALSLSTGQYVMWLADDDVIDRDYVQACVQALQNDSGRVLVAGHCQYVSEAGDKFAGQFLNLAAPWGWLRVLKYYAWVSDNSMFYGVMRRQHALACQFPDALGGDWIFVASLAMYGNVLTLPSPCLYRGVGGASHDLARIARAQGFSGLSLRYPYLGVAKTVWSDMMSSQGSCKNLLQPWRFMLAGLVFCMIVGKKVLLRECYRLIRKA